MARSADVGTILKAQFADLAIQDPKAFAATLEADYAGNQRLIRSLKLSGAG